MNVILSKDEKQIKKNTFITHLILFWLKTNFVLTNKRVMGQKPNSFLGMFPLKKTEINYPLKKVINVSFTERFYFLRFLIGGILVLLAITLLMSGYSIIAIIVFLISLLPLFNSYTFVFRINNYIEQAPVIEVSILEKDKVERFVSDINQAIADQ